MEETTAKKGTLDDISFVRRGTLSINRSDVDDDGLAETRRTDGEDEDGSTKVSRTDRAISSWSNENCMEGIRRDFVLTHNGKVLLVAIVLFSTITAAQFAAAFIANSLALLADCGAMLADVITYIFNFIAECRPNRSYVTGKLVAAFVSLVVLIAIAIWAIIDAITALHTEPDPNAAVSPYVVLGFGLLGILFDILAIIPYYKPQWLGPVSSDAETQTDSPEAVDVTPIRSSTDCSSFVSLSNVNHPNILLRDMSEPCVEPSPISPACPTKETRTRINMVSALLHIGADTLRSCTTVAAAIVMLVHPSWDSNAIDSYAALVVSTLVISTGLIGFVIWTQELVSVRRKRSAQDKAKIESLNRSSSPGPTQHDTHVNNID